MRRMTWRRSVSSIFSPGPREDVYVTASRWVPYKRVDLIVAAFRALPGRRLVVVGDGPEAPRVRAAAGPNVEFVGEVARDRLRDLLRAARAFVFAADEDFGKLPVEAQACGTPVIAYGRGGALETVRGPDDPRPTGLFFPTQSAEAIAEAVGCFERELADAVRPDDCRTSAERFSVARFRSRFATFVGDARSAFAAALR
jgi:glycosyltransferase involved in cell wall biosynthesis